MSTYIYVLDSWGHQEGRDPAEEQREHAEMASEAGSAMHAMTIVGCGSKEKCPANAAAYLLEPETTGGTTHGNAV